MVTFTMDTLELLRNMNAYAFAADTPDTLRDKLTSIPGVDADRINAGREILYAHYDLLSDEGKAVLAQLAQYAVAQNWATENADGRSEKIRDAARRDLGDGKFHSPDKDPDPRIELRDDNVNWKNERDGVEEPTVPEPV